MDIETINVYDAEAATIAPLQRAVTPELVYRLIGEYFRSGARTADVGCGSGRDTAWLTASGFRTTGYDASRGMLEQARATYPQLELREAALPELAAIDDAQFMNVLCNAVLMHLPHAEHGRALMALSRIMQPGGRLILTFRPSLSNGEREPDGRLFAAPVLEALGEDLAAAGLAQARVEQGTDTRPGVRWYALVVEKSG